MNQNRDHSCSTWRKSSDWLSRALIRMVGFEEYALNRHPVLLKVMTAKVAKKMDRFMCYPPSRSLG